MAVASAGLGHMQVCTLLQTDYHASTPSLSFFTGRMPFLPPNQHRQCSEGTVIDFSELKTHCVHWVSGLVLYRAVQRKVKHVNNFLSCTFISADAWVKQRLNSHCCLAVLQYAVFYLLLHSGSLANTSMLDFFTTHRQMTWCEKKNKAVLDSRICPSPVLTARFEHFH